MPIAHLDGRALIAIDGEDAFTFLQNILTVDLAALPEATALPGALLTPQGKILFDFLVSRTPAGFRLDCPSGSAADFRRRLMMYRLRAKAEISEPIESLVAVSWNGDSDTGIRDGRFPPAANVFRLYGELPAETADPADWDAFRIASGVPESGVDFVLGDAFPHDALLDQTGGVGFRKGCYVGQEVVSRMQHRGTARRRVLIARANAPLPSPGTEITAGARAIGTLGSVAGRTGLAMVRIDRVKAAIDQGTAIEAGGIPLMLSIPDWAGFTFPQASTASDADA